MKGVYEVESREGMDFDARVRKRYAQGHSLRHGIHSSSEFSGKSRAETDSSGKGVKDVSQNLGDSRPMP